MVVFKGLSPEETFEYEELLIDATIVEVRPARHRLDEPNTKHCSALKRQPANGTV